MSLWDKIIEGMPSLTPEIKTLKIFQKNKKDMENTNIKYSDKYFHAKANCQSIQNNFNPTFPFLLDIGKEIVDVPNKTFKKKVGTLESNLTDSLEDLNADFYGMQQGYLHPFSDCRYILKNRPAGLDEKY